jgi:16S rRNA (guanine(966)-N(2))-methyltransferase RsmD
MRLIAGHEHGRRLRAPRGTTTRPATARVRASIFSRLAARRELAATAVLDLFAGSGSLGLEALSRGAASAVFVDSSRAAAAAISDNLERLGLAPRGRVLTADWQAALLRLARERATFDLVFLDPPFAADYALAALAKLAALELLKPDGIVTAHTYYRTPVLSVPGFEVLSSARLGDHRVALYRLAPAAVALDGKQSHAEQNR